MLVTCITITQAGRLHMLADSIRDFLRQTHPEREQLIVHDGSEQDHADICSLADRLAGSAGPRVRVHRAAPGTSLGQLRNVAVAESQGDIICQWDDDDRYHPLRLALQYEALRSREAAFCFLVDQLHGYREAAHLTWDDWDSEPYPLNFIQGTLMGYRAQMPEYPSLARGEDTAACLALLSTGRRIARLRGVGWCYVYMYHGRNVWSRQHHWSISQAKQLQEFKLRARLHTLRQRLREYDTSWDGWTVGHRTGALPLLVQ